jgi:hypothetical protein
VPDVLAAALAAVADAVGLATGTGPSPERRADYVAVAGSRLSAIGALGAAPQTAPGGRLPALDPIAPVRSALGDPWHRSVLAAWSVIEPLGGLAPGAMVGPTSRAWFDELRLATPLVESLGTLGIDDDAALAATERVRAMLPLPRPSNIGGRSIADRARRLADGWLGQPDVRALVGLNTWDGQEWLDRERWRELLDWTLLLDALDRGDGRVPLAASATVVGRLADAAESAGYRVDRLRDAVAPRPRSGRTSGTARTPRAPRQRSAPRSAARRRGST